MIFQDSIGIEVREDRVVMAWVRGTFRGVKLAAHTMYGLEQDRPLKERLGALNALLAEFRRENHIGTTDIFLGIPGNMVMFREIEFPLAVRENLRATLRYEMEKYVPVPVEDIWFDHQVVAENRAAGRLKVLLAVVKKKDMSPYLEFCRTVSGGVSGIGTSATAAFNALAYGEDRTAPDGTVYTKITEGPETKADISGLLPAGISAPDIVPAFGLALRPLWQTPLCINLLPEEFRRRPNRTGYYMMGGLAIIVLLTGLAWGGSHILKQRMAVRELDAEMQRLASEVAETDRVQKEISNIEARLDRLESLTRDYVPRLDILRELTQIIPDTAWVQDFSISEKGGGRITGYAESASELIPLLESSALFQDVIFLSTTVKDRDGRERFSIGFQVVPLSENSNS